MSTTALLLSGDTASLADLDESRSTIRRGTRLIFEGRPGAFLKLLVTGALWQIPTFGFYRFWLITRLRRHLWANTRLGSDPFEYTGTGKELFIGFLIAMAVLVPIYIAYTLLGLIAETVKAFASLPLVLVLYLLGQFGAYRARRYRASRTVFRGLRFWMTGSGWGYAFRALGWGLLAIATLGLSLPWGLAALERYRMRRTHYGTLQGDFVGTGRQLAKRTWWLWVLAVPVPIAALATIAIRISDLDVDTIKAMIGLGLGGMYLLLIVLTPLFLAAHAGWQANGIRLGAVAVHSDIGTGAFFGTFLKLLLSAIALLILFAIAAALFAMGFADRLKPLAAGEVTVGAVGAVVVGALGYLALILGAGVLSRYFLGRGLWAVLAASVTVSNLSALDEAVAAGDSSNAFGESFAEAFNFGGL